MRDSMCGICHTNPTDLLVYLHLSPTLVALVALDLDSCETLTFGNCNHSNLKART